MFHRRIPPFRFVLTLFLILLLQGALLIGTAAARGEVLAVGDLVEIVLPGETDFADPFAIDERGRVVLPEVGPVSLAGLTREEAEVRLREMLANIYRDSDAVQLRIRERRLLITVLGFVEKPGPVSLPADANVQAAIVAAEGLRQGAQLDKLQLRRPEGVSTFDYKRYLDTGRPESLPALRSGDTIFVPSSPLIGNVEVAFDARALTAAGDAGGDETDIKVFGEVQKPGTFSFKPGLSIVDVIMRAGGLTRYAGVEKIRLMNGAAPRTFNLKNYFDTGDADLLPTVEPGATLYVPTHVDDVKAGARTVYVMGEVAKPGSYEMTGGATFFDVLANAGGPNRYAETRQIRIIRADGAVVPFDLASFTEGVPTGAAPEIRPGDAIFVPEKTDQNEKSWLKIGGHRAIRIMGQVNRPGRYEWSNRMSLLDLLAHAGGPTARADTSQLKIVSVRNGQARPEIFDLQAFINKGGAVTGLPRLLAGDSVVVPELPRDPTGNKSQWVRQDSDRSIYVMGAVGSPGRYAFNTNLHFLDILSAADGPTRNADLQNIRISHRDGAQSRISRLDLARYFETGDDRLLPRVVPGDVIYVPDRNREWTETDPARMVRVLGSVRKPGRYKYNARMSLLDLLAEAGGPSADAWQDRIVVVRMEDGETRGETFDLVAFARSNDYSKLPQVRAGDTIYVPSLEQSDWRLLMRGVRDIFQVVSTLVLIGGL